jgi:hypothetical protein
MKIRHNTFVFWEGDGDRALVEVWGNFFLFQQSGVHQSNQLSKMGNVLRFVEYNNTSKEGL